MLTRSLTNGSRKYRAASSERKRAAVATQTRLPVIGAKATRMGVDRMKKAMTMTMVTDQKDMAKLPRGIVDIRETAAYTFSFGTFCDDKDHALRDRSKSQGGF